MESNNRHIIFRNSECVDKETLIEYKRNKLTGDHKHIVEQHLVDCELCSDALEGYGTADNIKLDVYALKLKVLNISERPDILKVVYKNKNNIRIAAGILVLIGIFSLFLELIKNIGSDNENIVQTNTGELKNPNKIDYNYEINIPQHKKEKLTDKDEDINRIITSDSDESENNEISVNKEEELNVNENSIPEDVESNEETSEQASGQTDGQNEQDLILEEPENEENEQTQSNPKEDTEIAQTNDQPSAKMQSQTKQMPETFNESAQVSGGSAGAQTSKGDVIVGMNKIQLTKQIRNYYDNNEFAILMYTFEEYITTIADDTELLYYAAYAYNANSKSQKAIKYYNKVIESQDPYYKVEAKWHLAKIYLELNNKSKAKSLFEDLVSSNSRYKSQAKDEIKKLKQAENKNIKNRSNNNNKTLSSPQFH